MKRFFWSGLAVIVLAIGCAPNRTDLAGRLRQAIQNKDSKGTWALLDGATRAKVLAGIERSRKRAAADAQFKSLFVGVNPTADPALPAEDLAMALIAQQLDTMQTLGRTEAMVPPGDKGLRMARGLFASGVAAEPMGFCESEGMPVTLALRFCDPLPYNRDPSAAGVTEFRVHVDIAYKTDAEICDEYLKASTKIAQMMALGGEYDWQATRVMEHYLKAMIERKGSDVAFSVGVDGRLVATSSIYNDASHRVDQMPEPPLSYGIWP